MSCDTVTITTNNTATIGGVTNTVMEEHVFPLGVCFHYAKMSCDGDKIKVDRYLYGAPDCTGIYTHTETQEEYLNWHDYVSDSDTGPPMTRESTVSPCQSTGQLCETYRVDCHPGCDSERDPSEWCQASQQTYESGIIGICHEEYGGGSSKAPSCSGEKQVEIEYFTDKECHTPASPATKMHTDGCAGDDENMIVSCGIVTVSPTEAQIERSVVIPDCNFAVLEGGTGAQPNDPNYAFAPGDGMIVPIGFCVPKPASSDGKWMKVECQSKEADAQVTVMEYGNQLDCASSKGGTAMDLGDDEIIKTPGVGGRCDKSDCAFPDDFFVARTANKTGDCDSVTMSNDGWRIQGVSCNSDAGSMDSRKTLCVDGVLTNMEYSGTRTCDAAAASKIVSNTEFPDICVEAICSFDGNQDIPTSTAGRLTGLASVAMLAAVTVAMLAM